MIFWNCLGIIEDKIEGCANGLSCGSIVLAQGMGGFYEWQILTGDLLATKLFVPALLPVSKLN